VGVVDHLDQAERLWRRNGVVATYVTPAGEVLSPTGRLTGGRRDGDREAQEHSLLRRKRAIRQLRDEVAAGAIAVEQERGRGHRFGVGLEQESRSHPRSRWIERDIELHRLDEPVGWAIILQANGTGIVGAHSAFVKGRALLSLAHSAAMTAGDGASRE